MRPTDLLDRLAARALGPSEADLADNLELAVSAHTFSRRTTAVVDDKLSFSATLMRAGEVDAAQRLLAEVEEEVMIEEAALIERVNEVKVARAMSAQHMTRGRLARTLAVAMIGSSLLAFSAAGMAVVGLFKDNDRAIHGSDLRRGEIDASDDAGRGADIRPFKIAGISVDMTAAQQKRYKKMAKKGFSDPNELELFLLELLPTPLAERLHAALVTGVQSLPAPVRSELEVAIGTVDAKHREVAASQPGTKKRSSSSSPSEEPREEPSEEPAQSEDKPREEPSPSPTPEDHSPNLPIIGGDEGGGSDS